MNHPDDPNSRLQQHAEFLASVLAARRQLVQLVNEPVMRYLRASGFDIRVCDNPLPFIGVFPPLAVPSPWVSILMMTSDQPGRFVLVSGMTRVTDANDAEVNDATGVQVALWRILRERAASISVHAPDCAASLDAQHESPLRRGLLAELADGRAGNSTLLAAVRGDEIMTAARGLVKQAASMVREDIAQPARPNAIKRLLMRFGLRS